ncbi:hypothetical protein [Streptomyces lancefieldiae]|uniref:Uncharacterized protein n=1 Tax=Streptomyces lancefieldiae TaxID=3075520 RepID=A0ABU3ATD9_9ACTN|nr:hypothetical protein [Streptomyces sp. DSM 40712]MDT0613218.1 hypothetical protein [Streptomyces sp. DSM 40712]
MRRTRNPAALPGGGPEGPRGRTRRGLFAALVTLPALVLLPLLVAFASILLRASDDRDEGRADAVPCSEALAFGGAALPDGARPVGACLRQGFQDTHYSAAFRMPRTGVQGWLAHTYPDAPAPGTAFCPGEDADLCLDPGPGQGLPAGADAHAVQVRVVYEGAGTALVRFASFTV